MTIQEILTAHTQSFDWYPCKCGWKPTWDGRGAGEDQHRAHVAEVLDKHMQAGARRAQVNALNGVASAWEEVASPGAHHLYARMLRETANRIGAEPNGR